MNRSVLALCAGVLVGVTFTHAGAEDPRLGFRGAGSTRAALNDMQLKPFDHALWSNLSNFTGPEFKKDELKDKVVLVVTWSNFYRISHGAMKSAQSLHEKYKDKGLVVIGVHNPRSPEGAAEVAKTLGLGFTLAEDKDGKFRAGLKADQDPNVYVIDRAGQLRYAQLETSSMDAGVTHLIGETAEKAADYPKMLDKRKADAEADRWKTQDSSSARPVQGPEIAFPEPDPEAYTSARWPYKIGKSETDNLTDKTKYEFPTLKGWPEEDWHPSTPKHAGKLRVVYFMDPKEVDMLEVIPKMNRLYDKYHRDAVVCAGLYKDGAGGIGNTGNSNNSGSGDSDDEKLKNRNKELLPALLKTHPLNHFITPVVLRAEGIDSSDGNFNFLWSGKREEFGICCILSTDGKFRWLGNAHDPSLGIAIERIAAVDPGVQARKRAEAAAKSGKLPTP